MKRLICLLVVGTMVLSGCTSEPKKTEEELRAEIKAELQAEMEEEAAKVEVAHNDIAATEVTPEATEINEEQAVVEKRTDVYYTEDLKAGVSVSDKFKLLDDFYYETDGHTLSYGYEIGASEAVAATLIYNMEYDFYFLRVDEPIFNQDIMVKNPTKENGEELISMARESLELGVNPKKSQITEATYKAAKASDTYSISGQAVIENILVVDDEESGTYSVIVKAFTPEGGVSKKSGAHNFDKMPTLGEMCSVLGITISDMTTNEDGGYFMYYSHWANDDIYFEVYHDEESLSADKKISGIQIKGGGYTIMGLGYGDNLQASFDFLDQELEHVYSHHDDSYAKYVYHIDYYALTLNQIGFDSSAIINPEDTITNINFYELLD